MATAKKAAPKKAAAKDKSASMAPFAPGDKLPAVSRNKSQKKAAPSKKVWEYIKKNRLQDKAR